MVEREMVRRLLNAVALHLLATKKATPSAAGKAVAKRGIVLSSAHNNRSTQGNRFPESARKSAQQGVRKALGRA